MSGSVNFRHFGAAVVCLAMGASTARAVDLAVVATEPARHAGNAAIDTTLSVEFDRAVNPATINATSFRVFGHWSGRMLGAFSLTNADKTVVFTLPPGRHFSANESVFVNLSHGIEAADGEPLRSAGYAWQFGIRAAPASLSFIQIDSMSNRTTPGVNTRIYGAQASDLNNDGFLDLTTVNEDSHDLRVFMNLADGTGLYGAFLTPPLPIGVEASPNETGDFNNDGFSDAFVAAASSHNAWLALGNGDGTFATPQSITVGNEPHGVAVLDIDGDADWDAFVSCRASSNVARMINNDGVLSAATFFEGGGDGEYGLTSADMNEDGIFDLIVATRDSQQIIVHLGNGDGTFTALPAVSSGGATWVVEPGDVNGDGHMDLSTANSFSHTGSILIGDGTGALAAAVTQSTASHCVSTDLGDLDGDGDPDWVLSSFSGGQWRVFTNDGAGNFTFNQTFFAPSNPSCSILLDFDNDGDLDMALTDEIADLVILMKQRGPLIKGDMNCDGRVDGDDVQAFVLAMLDAAGYATTHPGCVIDNGDMQPDGVVDDADVAGFVDQLIP